jgi:hypothetical protein
MSGNDSLKQNLVFTLYKPLGFGLTFASFYNLSLAVKSIKSQSK